MLTVHNLHKSYQVGKTTYEVLKGVSLEVGKGEFVACNGTVWLRKDHHCSTASHATSLQTAEKSPWAIASWPSWMKPPWPLFETNSLGLSFRIFCC